MMQRFFKKDFIAAGIFLLLILAAYPLSWARTLAYGDIIRNWSYLEGFSWEIISYFAVGFTILKYRELYSLFKNNLLLAVGTGVFLTVLILQQIC